LLPQSVYQSGECTPSLSKEGGDGFLNPPVSPFLKGGNGETGTSSPLLPPLTKEGGLARRAMPEGVDLS